jgi:hypothetical protein
MMALGNKRARTVVAGVAMKAVASLEDGSGATERTYPHSIGLVIHRYGDI